jgi:polar amino acid transport system permease protein
MVMNYQLIATVILLAIMALPGYGAASDAITNPSGPVDNTSVFDDNIAIAIIAREDTEAMSKIADAKIFIDGAYVGTTDTADGKILASVSPGDHSILITKNGLNSASGIIMSSPRGNYTFLLSGAGKKYSIFDLDVFFYSLYRELAFGAVNTITLSITSMIIGMAIGLAMGIGRVSSGYVARNIASIYVETIRGVPLLLLLLFIKYGLPFLILDTFGYRLIMDAFTACVIAISMNSGAYMGEIFKAGINAIPRGQTEAARSLGMSYWQSLRYIVLPQALKIVLPALGNEFISVIKGSSIGLVIAYQEIVWWSNSIGAEAYNTFMPLLAAGIIYLSMTIPLSKAIQYMETKLSSGDVKEPRAGWFGKKRKIGGVPEDLL